MIFTNCSARISELCARMLRNRPPCNSKLGLPIRPYTMSSPLPDAGSRYSRSHGSMAWWFDRWSAIECCFLGRCTSVRAHACGMRSQPQSFTKVTLGFSDPHFWAHGRGPAGCRHPRPSGGGGPAPTWRLATAGWSNPSEQRARTGLNQFVSDAQCVWFGGRTECPHRRRAPEGWQASVVGSLSGQESWPSVAESYHRSPRRRPDPRITAGAAC